MYRKRKPSTMAINKDIVKKIGIVAASLQSRRVGVLALGVVIGILAAACSGAIANPSTSADSQDGAEETDNLAGTEEFGLSREELVTSVERIEELIANCMSEAGFEYVANDYNTVRQGMTADQTLPGLSEEEFIEQYGYGISTLYTGLPPQLADVAIPAQIGLGEQNVQLFKNLSSADQVAYNRTLFGENVEATLAVALETEDLSRTGGCTRTAIEQVFTAEQLSPSYTNPKDALIEQDPRMVAALAEYAECIQEAGFRYSHEKEIEPDLRNRLYTITEGASVESLSADAQAALTALQGEERALAIASYECEGEIIEPVEDQVEQELFADPDQ
jgi:hypothetical protein